MDIVMGVMIVIMVFAFLGSGHHGHMMGGHGKEIHDEETVGKKRTQNEPCVDCAGQIPDAPKKTE